MRDEITEVVPREANDRLAEAERAEAGALERGIGHLESELAAVRSETDPSFARARRRYTRELLRAITQLETRRKNA